jgi:hypothetical protein
MKMTIWCTSEDRDTIHTVVIFDEVMEQSLLPGISPKHYAQVCIGLCFKDKLTTV